ncbi:DUF6448 family protein [Ramlibacter tataouinensis]|uniref:DUF6448 family protein n=1 Tax=Ramlibacter tataouinensis TaxID=94132 RepID=UPI0022F3B372|nr:DUF6448 family protein [Ramlibacter tataouinensis]WBY01370.1 DUF6448 family protein [Ramlibacter tataouinensis]
MFFAQLLRSLAGAIVPTAQAHCDTTDGPAVTDGRRALATGNINHALKWIQADGEAELKEVFTKALAVRKLGPQAAEVADRLFLETLVRIHRMGEGVGFTGIQPTGAHVEPIVAAADRALETGDDREVRALAPAERRDELHRRFHAALGKKGFDVDDVPAARDYVAAYVSFFKYAEGEDHDHGHPVPAGGAHAHPAEHRH